MGDLQLVIFDSDGVLVDSEVISNRVLARLLTAAGLPMTLAETRRDYQGLLLDEVVTVTQDRFGHHLPADFLKDEDSEVRQLAADALWGLWFRADSEENNQELQRLVRLRDREKALAGLDRLIPSDAVFSAYSVPRGKPHPDLFLYAAEQMGADPAGCVVVEDTPLGVTAAVAAGMRVFGFSADSDEAALRRAGAEILHSLDQLPALLGLDG